ncbi:hypothetical protein EDB85DRAFT_2164461 [Lactarius pseudohatsudake]|nr:hypothetical protein EDB85DRAFT_2164461 [Lactarius pseudohatsudake]
MNPSGFLGCPFPSLLLPPLLFLSLAPHPLPAPHGLLSALSARCPRADRLLFVRYTRPPPPYSLSSLCTLRVATAFCALVATLCTAAAALCALTGPCRPLWVLASTIARILSAFICVASPLPVLLLPVSPPPVSPPPVSPPSVSPVTRHCRSLRPFHRRSASSAVLCSCCILVVALAALSGSLSLLPAPLSPSSALLLLPLPTVLAQPPP